jgi:hypothetical protein
MAEFVFTTVKGAMLFGVLAAIIFVYLTGGYKIGDDE